VTYAANARAATGPYRVGWGTPTRSVTLRREAGPLPGFLQAQFDIPVRGTRYTASQVTRTELVPAPGSASEVGSCRPGAGGSPRAPRCACRPSRRSPSISSRSGCGPADSMRALVSASAASAISSRRSRRAGRHDAGICGELVGLPLARDNAPAMSTTRCSDRGGGKRDQVGAAHRRCCSEFALMLYPMRMDGRAASGNPFPLSDDSYAASSFSPGSGARSTTDAEEQPTRRSQCTIREW
jgi:hypothetical protein